MGPAGLCRRVPPHRHAGRRRSRKSLILPGQVNSAVISGSGRSRPGRRPHPQGPQIRTGVRCLSLRPLLYFAAVRGLRTLSSGFRIISLTWVELWEFEPQTSCMPYSGNTSTRVHLCRSPSQDVRTSPPESRPVAVLSCCTPPVVRRSPGTLLYFTRCPPEIQSSVRRRG